MMKHTWGDFIKGVGPVGQRIPGASVLIGIQSLENVKQVA